MLTEDKDILVLKEFTIKLTCHNYMFYSFLVETKTERFRSTSLEEIGDWVKEKFGLTDDQLQDIGRVCSGNSAIAFKDFALEYNG